MKQTESSDLTEIQELDSRKIRDSFRGKRKLSLSMIRKLHEKASIPAQILMSGIYNQN